MNIKDVIEEGVYTSPLTLLSIKNKDLINSINNYLPYSIGIEIECNKSSNFSLDKFTTIPDILSVDIDDAEQRFRIPNGLSGLICLYNICNELKSNSELNPDSGHHYHIDMTNVYNLLNCKFIELNSNWILNELDTWGYKGTYNRRDVQFSTSHTWVRFQESFKTAEFRIGNMTFEYDIIVKRLIHASNIIQRLNKQLISYENIIFNKPNIELLKYRIEHNTNSKLEYLINKLSKFKESSIELNNDEKKEIIKNRIIKI